MRTIRVKQQNQTAVIEALKAAGFEAKHSKITPLSHWESEWNADHDADQMRFNSKVGMAGIETSASGNQAHKVIKQLKATGVIQ